MKPKPVGRKSKPAQRQSRASKIRQCPDDIQKRHIAYYGRELTNLEALTDKYLFFYPFAQQDPEACHEARQQAAAPLCQAFLTALECGETTALHQLADFLQERMDKTNSDPKRFELLMRQGILNLRGKGETVNFRKLAMKLVDAKYEFTAKHGSLSKDELQNIKAEETESEIRNLRRIAGGIGVKTGSPGRRKQQDI